MNDDRERKKLYAIAAFGAVVIGVACVAGAGELVGDEPAEPAAADAFVPEPPPMAAPSTVSAPPDTAAPGLAPLEERQRPGVERDLRDRTLANRAAYIPPQCYTSTDVEDGPAANPCFTCHVMPRSPNFVIDHDLQLEHAFPEYARTNRWANLFEDRTEAVAAIDDATIDRYVAESNYLAEGELLLASVLSAVPEGWDFDGDGEWGGYLPDAYFDFDDEGFDRDPHGELTGWRAFAYAPTPGTFWPTNGSMGDALIRLGDVFREDEEGSADRQIYVTNLAIVEALIRRADVPIAPTDEAAMGVDLDKDGALGTATRVSYDWAPLQGKTMSYVGRARLALEAGEVHLAAGLFPEGTEFLHTVRYLAVDGDSVGLAPRLKELRYARKRAWWSYSELEARAGDEVKEKDDFPDRLKQLAGTGDVEHGIGNGQGWVYQGFIEDARGDLRPQTFEEQVFCVGCHGGAGVTDDGIFSFGRKLAADGFQRGWFHPSQRGLVGMAEPQRADGEGEYAHYLRHARAGDELRANDEVLERFFEDGEPRSDRLEALAGDVSTLLLPSPERARLLAKAYLAIVREQDFIHGRDATITPPTNLHRTLDTESRPTGVDTPVLPRWRP